MFTVHAEGGDTVGDLKEKIEAVSGLLTHHVRLVRNNNVLEDQWRLAGLGIGPHSVVYLKLNLRGGGKVSCEHRVRSVYLRAQGLPPSSPVQS